MPNNIKIDPDNATVNAIIIRSILNRICEDGQICKAMENAVLEDMGLSADDFDTWLTEYDPFHPTL